MTLELNLALWLIIQFVDYFIIIVLLRPKHVDSIAEWYYSGHEMRFGN